ncbi:ING2-like protein [Mya arenaria]|uniref:ING2-like protein n=1 Tax=Mya arenaria TaxID=6604 RepID=A0ABY7G749_MYAAR|nr:ING2-like protein [Mya arenaria]
MKPMDSLSEKRLYRETLSAIEKARYLEKMKLIDNKDPYEATFVKGFSDDKSLLPTISYPDIVNYLIFTPSPYSKDDLKAYKMQAQCGWVSEVKAAVVGDRHVVIGKGFCVKQCGLFISEQFPYIGASPDGLVHCHCCWASLLEIKCPYTLKESLLDSDSEKYCLTRNSQGIMVLDHKHPYYYQVQTQMGVTGIRAIHFYILSLFCLTEICEKAETLMKVAILSELVGKFYSKLPGCGLPVQPLKEVQPTLSSQNETEKTWCYCDQVESGEMICCYDENCHIVWFHFTCLKIERKPRGKKWFCPDCRKSGLLKKKNSTKK